MRIMTWKDILTQINPNYFSQQTDESLGELVQQGFLDAETAKNKWLGNHPCYAEQIRNLESRLAVALPPSFKEFLFVSNGFKSIASLTGDIFSTEKIDWVINTEQEWLDILGGFHRPVSDEEYFDYSGNQDSAYFRSEYIKDCLKISEWQDGVIVLLNPTIKHGAEWEVIEHGTWYPGAYRYKSFFDFMLAKKNNGATL
jgi:hypothetical protein